MNKYYQYYLKESGFKNDDPIPLKEVGELVAVHTDNLAFNFPMSRWREIGCESFSIRDVPLGIYETFGVVAWGRFNNVVSEGLDFDIDVLAHQNGQFQVIFSEYNCNPDDCHNVAYTTTTPFFHIIESLSKGIASECRDYLVKQEIEEMMTDDQEKTQE